MGWLPIALALAGFVFFVVIVNYNSITTHKEAVMLAFFNFCQTAKARHTLLVSINEIPQSECSAVSMKGDFNLKRFPEYVKCIRQEKQSIEDSRLFLRINQPADRETRKTLKSLQVLNHRQHINIKVINRKVREYNQLISSYPTKMVAQSMGHTPLRYRS